MVLIQILSLILNIYNHFQKNKNVVYLGVIGFYKNDGYFCKFGFTSDIVERLATHKITFGNQFKLVYIGQTNDQVSTEDKFKQLLKPQKVNIEKEFIICYLKK